MTFTPTTVMVGDSVAVTTTVKNVGDMSGTYTAVFSVDGQETDKKNISVESGSTKDVSFQLSKTTAGSHKVAVGNSSATLTVYEWKPYKIQYDESDGSVMGIYVSGENGHIVHFTPPAKAFRIQTIRIFGTVNPLRTYEFDKKHITVRIWNKERDNQLWSQDFPWRLFMGDAWREIKVPDVRVDDDFHVEIVTHSNPVTERWEGHVMPVETPIEFVVMWQVLVVRAPIDPIRSVILIGFDYPQSYTSSPLNRPETRSGYSSMGKPFKPAEARLEGIRWLIRVEGEGPPRN